MVEVLTKYLKDVFDHDPRKPARIARLPRRLSAHRTPRQAETSDARGIDRLHRLDLRAGARRRHRRARRRACSTAIPARSPATLAALRARRPAKQHGASACSCRSSRSARPVPRAASRSSFSAQRRSTRGSTPDQPLILLDHIRCAAFELPFAAARRFGGVKLDRSARLSRRAAAWCIAKASAGTGSPTAIRRTRCSLRSVADGNFVVVDRTDGSQTIIAEVDYSGRRGDAVRRRDPHGAVDALPGGEARLGRAQGVRDHARTSTTTPTRSTTRS